MIIKNYFITFSPLNNIKHHPRSLQFYLFILSMLVFSTIQAQQEFDTDPPCGYDLIPENNLPLPSLPLNFNTTGSYVIPVVVHVFHQNGPENISDAQILSGIEEMNMQFSGAEGGTDAQIEFRLATLDPNGNCTNGIVRIFNQPAGVNLGSLNSNDCTLTDIDKCNLSRWPITKYMNIWIVEKIRNSEAESCNDSGIRGFSVSGSGLRRGITIKYKHFGTIETASYGDHAENINTDTHEAGHFLGLHHPWGINSSCSNACEQVAGANCQTHGDMVCDTDPCNGGASTTDCTNLPLSCTDCAGFDFTNYSYPADNYMSYNTQCHFRFTPGQIERMHGMLETQSNLNNLYTNSNLTATGTSDVIYNNQIVLNSIIIPSSCPAQNNGSISVSVENGT